MRSPKVARHPRSIGPRPTDAELAQLVAMLGDAGLVEVYVDEQGREAYRLTDDGVRVGNMLSMVEGEDADAVSGGADGAERGPLAAILGVPVSAVNGLS